VVSWFANVSKTLQLPPLVHIYITQSTGHV